MNNSKTKKQNIYWLSTTQSRVAQGLFRSVLFCLAYFFVVVMERKWFKRKHPSALNFSRSGTGESLFKSLPSVLSSGASKEET